MVGEVARIVNHATPVGPHESWLAMMRQTMLDLMHAARDGGETVLDLWQVEGNKRKDLRARVKAVKNSGVVADYPPEVLRATMGRYVALEVL